MIKHALIDAGNEKDPTVLMLHGGPGYYWSPQEIKHLGELLTKRDTNVYLRALQARGCGRHDAISVNDDILDDDLLKRAEDLSIFNEPDILLGHSTGAMVALTAVMEGFIKPKAVLLVSPYTASLGEHDYWVTHKAARYPRAFKAFHNFVRDQWAAYKGEPPADLREKLYMYWGELFFDLPNDTLKLEAKLHYLNFHVIDAVPAAGSYEDGEPYTHYTAFLTQVSAIEGKLKDDLLRIATITANWWRTNFQNGYDFIGQLTGASFGMPLYILSGQQDEITPTQTVMQCAAILGIAPVFTPNGHHLPESAMRGTLKEDMADMIAHIVATRR